eukprot:scaffold16300_cov150-Cylindrotheca_fusiformis.AAC.2
MSDGLPTDIGDPISQQANGTDGNGTTDNNTTTSSESSDSGVSGFLYFFIVWIILLLLIVTLVPLLVLRYRSNGNKRPSASAAATAAVTEEEQHSKGGDTDDTTMVNENLTPEKDTLAEVILIGIVTAGAIVGMGLSIFAILSCDFLELQESITRDWLLPDGDGESIAIEFYSIGLWAVGLSSDPGILSGGGQNDACFRTFGFLSLDGELKSARAYAVIASVLGGLSLSTLIVGCANPRGRSVLRFLPIPLVLATLFQLLTLLLLKTKYCESQGQDCKLSFGAISSITAALYWFFCALGTLATFPMKRKERQQQ